jgi:hypothetical protein
VYRGSYAQDVRQPASLAGQSLTVSVASDVAQSCGGIIPERVIRQDIESQLRLANISVSKLHNAELATEVDCAPVRVRSRIPRESVHYCVALSQVISLSAARPASLSRRHGDNVDRTRAHVGNVMF